MDKNDLEAADTANNDNASANQQQEEKHVINPFEEKGEKLSKEEEENIEQFKETQTERN